MFYVHCCFTCNWVISATFTTLLTDGYNYKHNILFLITYLIEHVDLYNTPICPYVILTGSTVPCTEHNCEVIIE